MIFTGRMTETRLKTLTRKDIEYLQSLLEIREDSLPSREREKRITKIEHTIRMWRMYRKYPDGPSEEFIKAHLGYNPYITTPKYPSPFNGLQQQAQQLQQQQAQQLQQLQQLSRPFGLFGSIFG